MKFRFLIFFVTLLFLREPALLCQESRASNNQGAITAQEYCTFLNAVAAATAPEKAQKMEATNHDDESLGTITASNSNDLYDERMLGAFIMLTGLPGNYCYNLISNASTSTDTFNSCIAGLNWNDAEHYCNWKNHSASTSTYNLNSCAIGAAHVDHFLKSNQLTFQVVNTGATAYQAGIAEIATAAEGSEIGEIAAVLTAIVSMVEGGSRRPESTRADGHFLREDPHLTRTRLEESMKGKTSEVMKQPRAENKVSVETKMIEAQHSWQRALRMAQKAQFARLGDWTKQIQFPEVADAIKHWEETCLLKQHLLEEVKDPIQHRLLFADHAWAKAERATWIMRDASDLAVANKIASNEKRVRQNVIEKALLAASVWKEAAAAKAMLLEQRVLNPHLKIKIKVELALAEAQQKDATHEAAYQNARLQDFNPEDSNNLFEKTLLEKIWNNFIAWFQGSNPKDSNNLFEKAWNKLIEQSKEMASVWDQVVHAYRGSLDVIPSEEKEAWVARLDEAAYWKAVFIATPFRYESVKAYQIAHAADKKANTMSSLQKASFEEAWEDAFQKTEKMCQAFQRELEAYQEYDQTAIPEPWKEIWKNKLNQAYFWQNRAIHLGWLEVRKADKEAADAYNAAQNNKDVQDPLFEEGWKKAIETNKARSAAWGELEAAYLQDEKVARNPDLAKAQYWKAYYLVRSHWLETEKHNARGRAKLVEAEQVLKKSQMNAFEDAWRDVTKIAVDLGGAWNQVLEAYLHERNTIPQERLTEWEKKIHEAQYQKMRWLIISSAWQEAEKAFAIALDAKSKSSLWSKLTEGSVARYPDQLFETAYSDLFEKIKKVQSNYEHVETLLTQKAEEIPSGAQEEWNDDLQKVQNLAKCHAFDLLLLQALKEEKSALDAKDDAITTTISDLKSVQALWTDVIQKAATAAAAWNLIIITDIPIVEIMGKEYHEYLKEAESKEKKYKAMLSELEAMKNDRIASILNDHSKNKESSNDAVSEIETYSLDDATSGTVDKKSEITDRLHFMGSAVSFSKLTGEELTETKSYHLPQTDSTTTSRRNSKDFSVAFSEEENSLPTEKQTWGQLSLGFGQKERAPAKVNPILLLPLHELAREKAGDAQRAREKAEVASPLEADLLWEEAIQKNAAAQIALADAAKEYEQHLTTLIISHETQELKDEWSRRLAEVKNDERMSGVELLESLIKRIDNNIFLLLKKTEQATLEEAISLWEKIIQSTTEVVTKTAEFTEAYERGKGEAPPYLRDYWMGIKNIKDDQATLETALVFYKAKKAEAIALNAMSHIQEKEYSQDVLSAIEAARKALAYSISVFKKGFEEAPEGSKTGWEKMLKEAQEREDFWNVQMAQLDLMPSEVKANIAIDSDKPAETEEALQKKLTQLQKEASDKAKVTTKAHNKALNNEADSQEQESLWKEVYQKAQEAKEAWSKAVEECHQGHNLASQDVKNWWAQELEKAENRKEAWISTLREYEEILADFSLKAGPLHAHAENNHFPNVTIIESSELSCPGVGQKTRSRILQTDLPYPIRIEEIFDEATKTIVSSKEMVANHVLVTLQKEANPEQFRANLENYLRSKSHEIKIHPLELVSPAESLYKLPFEPISLSAFSEVLKATKLLAVRSEPDFLKHLCALSESLTSCLKKQWNLRDSFGVHAADLWSHSDNPPEAPSVTVAVVDTGIATHPDLRGNLDQTTPHWNALGNNNNIEDKFGHGTKCAGIIGAIGNGPNGIAGVTLGVKLMGCKVSDNHTISVSKLISCFQHAYENGAHILNCSFANDTYSQAEFDALLNLRNNGVIVVTAAGNQMPGESREAMNNDNHPTYPANYGLDNIISVTATTQTGTLRPTSHYGKTTVHLAAPGSDIPTTGHLAEKPYISDSGTSFAAPHVSGALALMKEKFPRVSYGRLIQQLLDTTDKTEELGFDENENNTIAGKLNLTKALNPEELPLDEAASFISLRSRFADAYSQAEKYANEAEKAKDVALGEHSNESLWAKAIEAANTAAVKYKEVITSFENTTLEEENLPELKSWLTQSLEITKNMQAHWKFKAALWQACQNGIVADIAKAKAQAANSIEKVEQDWNDAIQKAQEAEVAYERAINKAKSSQEAAPRWLKNWWQDDDIASAEHVKDIWHRESLSWETKKADKKKTLQPQNIIMNFLRSLRS